MTTSHIDQLAQWYADAEQITDTNLPGIGDTLIFPYNAGGYAIEVEEDGWTPDDLVPGEPVRILTRAPKPKPAWHDAVAVMAALDVNSYDEWGDGGWPERRELWVRDGEAWESATGGITVPPGRLINVTPLIEAKVTDEMVEAARQEAKSSAGLYLEISLASRMLTAALGLETE